MLKLITDAAAIAADAAQIWEKVKGVTSRGIVLQVENKTRIPLVLVKSGHDSGGFEEPPDTTIPPAHVSSFGSAGKLPFQAGTSGEVQYAAGSRPEIGELGVDFVYHVSWNVPLLGDNTANSRGDGGARPYFTNNHSVGSAGQTKAKYELSELPTEDLWKRCSKCATLNHQRSWPPAVCITGGTLDNSTSRNYKVLFRSDPFAWKRCSRCQSMVTAPGFCHAGGLHDVTGPSAYTLLSDAKAPGEAGWRVCLSCTALVLVMDGSSRCPNPLGGGTHVLGPDPSFKLWFN